MKAYREINPDMLEAAMIHGLLRMSRGDKGDDVMIIKTDRFLDERRPKPLNEAGVSRDDNLYAYVRIDGLVIDITDGARVPFAEFAANRSGKLLELDIDPKRCFVSDLDTYDALKSAIATGQNQSALNHLAKSYWDNVVKLSGSDPSAIRRPEIMITYDVPATDIKAI